MSRVENIEGEVKSLSVDELKAFRDWFAQFDAEAWDSQIDTDAQNGKLRSLAERALQDHRSGRSTILRSTTPLRISGVYTALSRRIFRHSRTARSLC
jgi:hypothetical protein